MTLGQPMTTCLLDRNPIIEMAVLYINTSSETKVGRIAAALQPPPTQNDVHLICLECAYVFPIRVRIGLVGCINIALRQPQPINSPRPLSSPLCRMALAPANCI